MVWQCTLQRAGHRDTLLSVGGKMDPGWDKMGQMSWCHLALFSCWMRCLVSLTLPDPNLGAGFYMEILKTPYIGATLSWKNLSLEVALVLNCKAFCAPKSYFIQWLFLVKVKLLLKQGLKVTFSECHAQLLSCFWCCFFSNLEFCAEQNCRTGKEGERSGPCLGQSCNTGKVYFGISSNPKDTGFIFLPGVSKKGCGGNT